MLFLLAVMDMSFAAHNWLNLGSDALPDVDLIAPLIKAATFVSEKYSRISFLFDSQELQAELGNFLYELNSDDWFFVS